MEALNSSSKKSFFLFWVFFTLNCYYCYYLQLQLKLPLFQQRDESSDGQGTLGENVNIF